MRIMLREGLVFAVIILLIGTPFIPCVGGNKNINDYGENSNDEDYPIINFISEKIGNPWQIFWFNIGASNKTKYFFAEPAVIELEYFKNKTVNITWGVQDDSKNMWHRFQPNMMEEYTLYYDVVYPSNINKSALHATFNPPVIDILEYHEKVGGTDAQAPQPKTVLNLSLDINSKHAIPVKDFILKVKITSKLKYGDLINELGRYSSLKNKLLRNFVTSFKMMLGGYFQAQFKNETRTKYIDILVKVKTYRNAILNVPGPIKMDINELKQARIEIQNQGNIIEQYGFRVVKGNESIKVNCPGSITVYPGYIRAAYFGIIPKSVLYDPGTLNSVKFELYSHESNVTLANGTISVYTQGLNIGGIVHVEYIRELIIILIIILFLYILNIYIRRLRYAKIFKKPEKPWEIIEEKKYLEKLQKQKKLKEFNNTLKMMRNEYHSSLLWYKEYRSLLLRELRKKRKLWIKKSFHNLHRNVSNFLKQLKREKSEEPKLIKQKIIKKRPEEIKLIDSRREKIIRKIKRQQQKQKRRFEGRI